jgi:hypothetical protein
MISTQLKYEYGEGLKGMNRLSNSCFNCYRVSLLSVLHLARHYATLTHSLADRLVNTPSAWYSATKVIDWYVAAGQAAHHGYVPAQPSERLQRKLLDE